MTKQMATIEWPCQNWCWTLRQNLIQSQHSSNFVKNYICCVSWGYIGFYSLWIIHLTIIFYSISWSTTMCQRFERNEQKCSIWIKKAIRMTLWLIGRNRGSRGMNKECDEVYERSTKPWNLEMHKSSKGLWETPDSSDRVPKLGCQKSSGAKTTSWPGKYSYISICYML